MTPLGQVHRFARWWRSTKTPLRTALRRPWPTTLRGAVLACFSIAVGFLGWSNYIATELPPTNRESLAFALSIAPPHAWGWIMLAIGAFCLWTSYCHLGRDRLGFILLAIFCAAWGLGCIAGYLWLGAGTRALGQSVIWTLFSVILVLVSRFPNVMLVHSDVIADACHPGSES